MPSKRYRKGQVVIVVEPFDDGGVTIAPGETGVVWECRALSDLDLSLEVWTELSDTSDFAAEIKWDTHHHGLGLTDNKSFMILEDLDKHLRPIAHRAGKLWHWPAAAALMLALLTMSLSSSVAEVVDRTILTVDFWAETPI